MIMSIINRLKLIFFDLDDTLYEYHGETVRYVEKTAFSLLTPFIPLPKVLDTYELVKRQEDEEYLEHKMSMEDFYDVTCRFSRLLRLLGLDDRYLSEKMTQAYWEKWVGVIKPFLDTEFVLKELKKKYELGILTNGLMEQQRKRVLSIGLGEYFDYFFTSDSMNADKPSKEYFDFVLKAIKYKNHECALVGNDSLKDVESANNAGMVSIWYNRKGLQQKANAHYTITELKELLQIL